MTTVLVYGTLRSGHAAHYSFDLDSSPSLGTYRIPGSIYDLGAFPGYRPDQHEAGVVVEAYKVNDHQLAQLDRYEGYRPENPAGSLYLREQVEVPELGDAFIYVYNQELAGVRQRVESGDWKNR